MFETKKKKWNAIKHMLKSKYAITLALYTYVIFYFKRYTMTTISGILIDVHLIIPIVVSMILIYAMNYDKPTKKDLNEV